MPDIMIHCPVIETPVPTGLTTETIKFESLSGIEYRCRMRRIIIPFKDAARNGTTSRQVSFRFLANGDSADGI
jgi:hypothetical protein